MSQGSRSGDLLLKEVPLFKGLSPDFLRTLEGIARRRFVPKGDMLFMQGDRAEGFYVLLSGKVKVMKLSSQGKSQILGVFGPGDSVGEVAVFEDGTYPAYAQAIEDSTLAFLPRDRFIQVVRENPDLALGMMAILSRRLRRLTSLAESLALKEVPARLAQYLLTLASERGDEVVLGLKKGEIAEVLGTTPETLSRALSRLSARGIIEVKGSRVKIVDIDALRGLAEGQ